MSSTDGSPGGGEHAVSCILATYNNAAHVAEAIDSMLAQTLPPGEVIVVDPTSADGTAEIARSYGDSVRVIEIENLTPPTTRNVGIREARHDLIAFLDGDDRWDPRKLEIQSEAMAADPSLDTCFTHVQNFWADELAAERDHFRDHPRALPMPGYATTTMMARRSAFERFGLLDESLWFTDTLDWLERVRTGGGRDGLVGDVLTWHRIHPGGITRRLEAESRAEFVQHVRRHGRSSSRGGAGEG